MRKAEDPFLPFLGHNPPDFGIPLRPSNWPVPVDRTTGQKKVLERDPALVVDEIEHLYIAWRNSTQTWIKRLAYHWAAEPLRLFREQTLTLAHGYTQAVNNYAAVGQIQADNDQIHRLMGNMKDLRSFLFTHFGQDLDIGEAGGKSLFEICKTVMLEQKRRLEGK